MVAAILAAPGPMGRLRTVVEVTQVWGDVRLDQKQFGVGRPVTVGATARAFLRVFGRDVAALPAALSAVVGSGAVRPAWAEDFFAPDLAETEIVTGASVRVPAGWAARVYVDGRRVATPDGAIALVGDTRVVLAVESLCFVVRLADAGSRVVEPVADRIDWGGLAAGVVALGFIATLGLVAQRDVQAQSAAMPEAGTWEVKLAEAPPKQPTRASTRGIEGTAGDPKAKAPKAKGARGGAQAAAPRPDAGDALAMFDDRGVNALLGGAGLSAELGRAIGGLEGPNGAQLGTRGLGRRGDGFGMAGADVGLGGFPGADHANWGPGGPGGSEKPIAKFNVTEGEVLSIGSLDPALIDEVVKRNLPAIRYCYSRQLQQHDGLGGKIVIRFTIARDGSVSASNVKSSTMGSPSVESCVNRRFMGMKFPSPKAGIVVVSYPFVFQAG